MKPAPSMIPAGTIADCIVGDHAYERVRFSGFIDGQITELEDERRRLGDLCHRLDRRIEALRGQKQAMEGSGE